VIIVDGMGGDFAPREIVQGALLAREAYGLEIGLVGDETALREYLPQGTSGITIFHAPEVIGMDEHPVRAVRKKVNSSLVQGLRLVKEGTGSGFVSAGNTGATMAGALFNLGRLPGVSRPAISSLFPTEKGMCIIVDAGANVDCRPEHLQQFAVMGAIYSQTVLGRKEPGIALLNNGEEETKGCALTLAAHRLLGETPGINYLGFIEARDITAGRADVIVCDGFVGNILLKLAEGLGETLFKMLKEESRKNFRQQLGALLLAPGLRNLKKSVDYTEYGGAPLLGINGVCIIAHGSSNAKAIQNAIRVCAQAVEGNIVGQIGSRIEKLGGEGNGGSE
jgi:glycerol-3-phosphate acyltransferase PlsX